jgi:hypothetical protein
MPQYTATFYGSAEDVARLVGLAVAIATGKAQDPTGLGAAITIRAGNALLSKVQQAFVVKARGGVGEDGIKWAPLAPSTVAARLRKAGLPGTKGAAVAKVIKAARKVQKSKKPSTIQKALAAYQKAVDQAKQVYNPQLEILTDTGLLRKSFSPGVVEEAAGGAQFQVFKPAPGAVAVGTNRYPWHHTGNPPHLPARPFWPPDGRLPASWWEAVRLAAGRGVVQLVLLLLARAPKV